MAETPENPPAPEFGPPPMPDFWPSLNLEEKARPSLKSPGKAALLSLFTPGFGSIANGDIPKGVFIFLIFLTTLFAGAVTPLGFIFAPFVWAYGLYDAYNSAANYNKLRKTERV